MPKVATKDAKGAKATINERGVITIPAAMRQALGLKPHDEVLIEETEQGLLIFFNVTATTEIYTEKRIAEFSTNTPGFEVRRV